MSELALVHAPRRRLGGLYTRGPSKIRVSAIREVAPDFDVPRVLRGGVLVVIPCLAEFLKQIMRKVRAIADDVGLHNGKDRVIDFIGLDDEKAMPENRKQFRP